VRARYRYAAQVATLVVVYVCAGKLGVAVSPIGGPFTLVWAPTGIALAAVILLGYRVWPWLWLAEFLVDLWNGGSPAVAAVMSVAEPVIAVTSCWLLHRIPGFRAELDRVKDVVGFVVLAALLSPMTGVTTATLALHFGGQLRAVFDETWRTWWLGDAIGVSIVGSLLLTMRRRVVHRRDGPSWQRLLEGAALAILLCAAVSYSFFIGSTGATSGRLQRLFLTAPPLTWIALRSGVPGVARAQFVVAIIAIWATTAAHLPHDPSARLQVLFDVQLYLAIMSSTYLVLGAVSEERRRALQRHQQSEIALRESNRALRLLTMCNTAVVHATDEQRLLEDICRIAVDGAGYRMAWVGRAEHDEACSVRPVTFAGSGAGFFERARVTWADHPYGDRTPGTAIRTGRPAVGVDLLDNPGPWRDLFRQFGYGSEIAIPLPLVRDTCDVIVVYATESSAFDSTEVTLLQELGENVSHGLLALSAQKKLAAAMAELRVAHDELEERVTLRTWELKVRNEMAAEIGRRRQAEAELVKAKDAAEAADRIKSAFLATMSHELRTPLNSIIGFTGILLQGLAGPLNDEQKKQLGMVQRSSRHLLALINDVLDLSKIEAGQLSILRAPFDVNPALEDVVQTLAPLAQEKGLELRIEAGRNLGSVVGDRQRFEQILLNLLGNALKFTEHGSVTLRCAVCNGCLVVTVQDTGIGISPEQFPKLFHPFYQVDTGTTRKHEGTGLGLSISKRLTEMMGGTVDVDSTLGVGSRFTVRLPLLAGQA
jgi:signal transduction histidine kinase/integral membrane sensor domain MASE1